MSVSTYHVVFDATLTGGRYWWFPASGAAFFVIGLVWIAVQRVLTRKARSWLFRAQPYVVTAFALLWTILAASIYFYQYGRLKDALQSGRYEVVEGVVTHFVPMPPEGHASEHFEVDGHHYSYSDYGIQPGFNNTSSHGGPIREGLRVRIADVDGSIARLEIAE